ncbi:MAG: type II toxin-antitoxin system PemK/MazF family toxin [Candidatus Sulfomarinibacteraceae bacterium]
MSLARGEIYWVEFDPVKGSEQGGLRPALVVQNDVGNRYSPTTVVAAITRTIPPKPYPFVVVIEPGESGLPERSVVNCSQVATIQAAGTASRFRPPPGERAFRSVGKLGDVTMARVAAALRYNLGI